MEFKYCLNCGKINEDKDYCNDKCYREYKEEEQKDHDQRNS